MDAMRANIVGANVPGVYGTSQVQVRKLLVDSSSWCCRELSPRGDSSYSFLCAVRYRF